MALYRYVASKDELLMLMVDQGFGDPTSRLTPAEDWRSGLTRRAWVERDAFRARPWLLRVPIGGPPTMPNQTTFLELGLRYLDHVDLTATEKLSIMLLMTSFVRAESSLAADITAAVEGTGSSPEDWMRAYEAHMARIVDPERFPALRSVIDSGALHEPDDHDTEFIFGLERILDGIAVLIDQRQATQNHVEN